ncbi:MAG: SDR family NAD(P)-dependent oxidoreductase [Actinobacteria bacterium]|nr:SDR family NAD(P)-dependent oxidoreductase [Actinomycetota bacterium]
MRPPRIDDGTVVLDAFELGDVEACLAGEDEEQARRFGWFPERSTAATVTAAIGRRRESWEDDGGSYAFAVRDAASGELAGGVEVRVGEDRRGAISYWTFPAFRRRGFATRAVVAASDWALAALGLARLEVHAEFDNEASNRVARRAGFAREGVQRSHTTVGDSRRDMVLWSRTAPEPREAAARRPVAVITGASSGIGAAVAERLAAAGYRVVLGARRVERVRELAAQLGGDAHRLDVRSTESVEAFVAAAAASGPVEVLVNNAGLALGADRIEAIDLEDVRVMFETNVLGLLAVTRGLLSALRRAGHAHVVNVGSIAGAEVYPGGAGYAGTKHAVRAITRILRLELNGEPIRITEIAPGMVDTEFSAVRFKGDADAVAAVYRGLDPLLPEDVAELVAFAVERPPHVDVDLLEVRPLAQASATVAARRPEPALAEVADE